MNNYYILAPTDSDIQHHGILGQKWGKRQGPPYPLGSSDHSTSEKKLVGRRVLIVDLQELKESRLKKRKKPNSIEPEKRIS